MLLLSVTKFQFHKGTIKTVDMKTKLVELRNFNSIKVRLKQDIELICRIKHLNFNSIKVRLKPI